MAHSPNEFQLGLPEFDSNSQAINHGHQDPNANEDRSAIFWKRVARPRVSDHSCPEPSIRSGRARFSYVGPDGSPHSRRVPKSDDDRITPEGHVPLRLGGFEIDYLETEHQTFQLSDQDRYQPPVNDKNRDEEFESDLAAAATFEDDTLNCINRKGRLARVIKEVGLNPNSRLAKAIKENEREWETDGGSTVATQGDFNVTTQAILGSSLADTSDSGSLPSTKQVVQHPPHPRYAHAWKLHQERQSGKRVLIPEYDFPNNNRFPNCNALAKPSASGKQALTNPYRHQIPSLTARPTKPFASSPTNPFASLPTNPFRSSAAIPFKPSPTNPFRPSQASPLSFSPINPPASSSANLFTSSLPQTDQIQVSLLPKTDQTPSDLSRLWPRNLRFKISKKSKATNSILPTKTSH